MIFYHAQKRDYDIFRERILKFLNDMGYDAGWFVEAGWFWDRHTIKISWCYNA